MVEKNRIFHSIECRGQIVEAGVNRVALTDEFGDGLLSRESGVCAGHSTLVCCLC